MDFVILAHVRSGTALLSEFLNTNSPVHTTEEVFNPDTPEPESFFRYCGSRNDLAPEIRYRLDLRHLLFTDFLAHLKARFQCDTIGINVKYDHIHHLNGDWHNAVGVPLLITYLNSKQMGVIHLVRRNPFNQALSSLRAEKSGVWHSKDNLAPAPGSLPIDAQNLVGLAYHIRNLTAHFTQVLSHAQHRIDIFYEDMVANGSVSESTATRLSEFLGVPIGTSNRPAQQRLATADWRDSVQNWQEVERVAIDNGFGDFL